MPGRQRVVVMTAEVLGERMAGPAIRATHMAAELGAEHDVQLVTWADCEQGATGRHVTAADVDALVARTDVWVLPPSALMLFPQIATSEAVVVVDLYDPIQLENLEFGRDRPPRDRSAKVHNAVATLNGALLRGDVFLAASEQQRDFWLGALATLGRVNPVSYDDDPTLRRLIVVCPFGIDPRPPQPGAVLRGVRPGIGADDVVLIWGGGLYNWFDPLTLVRAVDVVRRQQDDVRLVFLAGRHPNPDVPTMRVAAECRALSDELGLTDRHVFFHEAWIPYRERGAYLLEADIGVSTHLDNVETAFSFRTRLLDYLWAGLPVVATDGDVFAGLLTASGAGRVVPAGDVAALADAIAGYAGDAAARRAAATAAGALARDFLWPRALAPLLAVVRDPRRAPDLLDDGVTALRRRVFEPVRAPTPGPPGWRGEVALARRYLATGGAGLLARRVATRAGKALRGRRD